MPNRGIWGTAGIDGANIDTGIENDGEYLKVMGCLVVSLTLMNRLASIQSVSGDASPLSCPGAHMAHKQVGYVYISCNA